MSVACRRCGGEIDLRNGSYFRMASGAYYHRACWKKAQMFGELEGSDDN